MRDLPTPPTLLIGRVAEIAAARDRLLSEHVRLVTLTGPGGAGKTRLALAIAAAVREAFSDGVRFVPLAPVREAEGVMEAIASTLGVQVDAGEPLLDALVRTLGERCLLLALDNFEQVLEAAPLLAELLAAAPRVKALVTSRAALRLQGEHEFPVPPLAVPARTWHGGESQVDDLLAYDAVRLFLARAQAARPDFALSDHNVALVAEVARRLDGLPLAIELAASRLRHMPVDALLAQLERRLPFLTGGARDLPERQQTLRRAVDWSHDLLAPAERLLFRRLGVFAGAWTLAAAEAVVDTPDLMDGLTALTDHSLVWQESASGVHVYRMLETIREYALEQLAAAGEDAQLRERHAGYYLALVEEAEPALKGSPNQAEWFARIERAHENVRAALDWYLQQAQDAPAPDAPADGDRLPAARRAAAAERGLRLASALWWFWTWQGHEDDGRRWLAALRAAAAALPASPETPPAAGEAAPVGPAASAPTTARASLAAPEGAPAIPPSVLAKATFAQGVLALLHADYNAARPLLEESLAAYRALGDPAGQGGALMGLGLLARYTGDEAVSAERFSESLAAYRSVDDRWGAGWMLTYLGAAALNLGDYGRARAWWEESLALRRQACDQIGAAHTLTSLGRVAALQGDHAAARAHLEEGLALWQALRLPLGMTFALDTLAFAAFQQGDFDAARSPLEESLTIWRRTGHASSIANSLDNLGELAHEQGETERARALFEESLALARQAGYRQSVARALHLLGNLAFTANDPAMACLRYEECLSIRRELSDRRGTAAVLLDLGQALRDRGEHDLARRQLEEGLRLCQQTGMGPGGARAHFLLGDVARLGEDQPRALAHYRESVAGYDEADDSAGVALSLLGMAQALLVAGHQQRAATLTGAALELVGGEQAPGPGDAVRSGTTSSTGAAGASGARPAAAGARPEAAPLDYRRAPHHRLQATTRGFARTSLAGPTAEPRTLRYGEFQRSLHSLRELRARAGGELGAAAYAWDADERTGRALSRSRAVALALEGRARPASPAARPMPASQRPPPLQPSQPLTARELEVAALVAEGLTNREIATRLFITERTVATHLEHILGKLGVRSRIHVAAWAIEQQRAAPS